MARRLSQFTDSQSRYVCELFLETGKLSPRQVVKLLDMSDDSLQTVKLTIMQLVLSNLLTAPMTKKVHGDSLYSIMPFGVKILGLLDAGE